MAETLGDLKTSLGEPPSRKTWIEKEVTTAAGHGSAENGASGKPGDDKGTLPVEGGFSIVPRARSEVASHAV